MAAGLIVLGILVAFGTAIYQAFRRLSPPVAILVSLLVTGLAVGLPAVLAWPVVRESRKPSDLSHVPYETSTSCIKCHGDHYDSWHRTYHRTMTQEALPGNVLGDFNDSTVYFKGLPCRTFRQEDRFFMDLVNPQWESQVRGAGDDPAQSPNPQRALFQVHRMVGSHNVQVYLTRLHNGSYMVLPLVWHIGEQRWITRAGSLLRPPSPSLYTGEQVDRWNYTCIACHNTDPKPGLVPQASGRRVAWNTQVTELGIACEACHGPGGHHITANRNPLRRYYLHETGQSDLTIVNPAKLSKELSVEACGRCHGKWKLKQEFAIQWLTEGDDFVPGGELLALRHQMPSPEEGVEHDEIYTGYYWQDRSPKVTGFEYQGVAFSACFQRGELTSLSCHSMHQADPDDQLKHFTETPVMARVESDQACLQCHQQYTDRQKLTEHTFHSIESSGSRCYNCHMPFQSYGLLKAVRNHRISRPNAGLSAQTLLPNACNQCHVDRTLEWTAQWLSRRYGQPIPPLSEDRKKISATLVDLLQGDALCRALAASQLGWSAGQEAAPGAWRVPFLAYALDDSYEAVRLLAYQSLRKLPGFEDFQFDYLADDQTRHRQLDGLRRRWTQTASSSPLEVISSVPLGPDGKVIDDTVDRLLELQDRSDVLLFE